MDIARFEGKLRCGTTTAAAFAARTAVVPRALRQCTFDEEIAHPFGGVKPRAVRGPILPRAARKATDGEFSLMLLNGPRFLSKSAVTRRHGMHAQVAVLVTLAGTKLTGDCP